VISLLSDNFYQLDIKDKILSSQGVIGIQGNHIVGYVGYNNPDGLAVIVLHLQHLPFGRVDISRELFPLNG
jgi:hypothetical protein